MSIRTEMKVPKEEIEKMLKALKEQEEEKKAQEKAQREAEEKKRIEEEQKKVQKAICESIKNKLTFNPSMSLAQEEILEDNSILLTINI